MSESRDWKYANTNPVFPCAREQLRVSNLMMQYDRCGLWAQERIRKLEADLRTLADAVLNAESTLDNDLLNSRVNNALGILAEARDTAMNWMSEP